MTRHQYTQNIKEELRTLNQRIDYKILQGQRYTEDSKRHKMLLRQISKQSKKGFFARLFPTFA